LIGPGTAALLFSGRLSLSDAQRRVSHRLGLSGRVHLAPFAELAMDMDKPAQFHLLGAALDSRQAPQ
jgi:hypothetical protein